VYTNVWEEHTVSVFRAEDVGVLFSYYEMWVREEIATFLENVFPHRRNGSSNLLEI
jgi:hypothetical protein